MHIHAHPNHPNKLFLFKHCCIYSTIFSNGHFRYLNWRYCTMYSHILEVYVTEDKMSEFLLWCNFLTVKILPMRAGARAAPMARDLHPCLQWVGADVDRDCSVEDEPVEPCRKRCRTKPMPPRKWMVYQEQKSPKRCREVKSH